MDTAENGQEAINKFLQNKYDAVLMDIFMPVLNGIEATKEIRKYEKEHQKEKTPILIVTGNYTKYDRIRT